MIHDLVVSALLVPYWWLVILILKKYVYVSYMVKAP